jgi:hypothetical protein
MKHFQVAFLNLQARVIPEALGDRIHRAAGDATALADAHGEIDLVYSESVIEHVGDLEERFLGMTKSHPAVRKERPPASWVETGWAAVEA